MQLEAPGNRPQSSPVRVKFWGTRGSLAKPGPDTIRYGGNTSCVQLTSPAGTLVVIDCGTGAQDLGAALLEQSDGPLQGNILISHSHWDHIQGFPFFAPLFVPGRQWDVYGPRGLGRSLRDTLAGQMEHTYFPISLDELPGRIRYHDLVEGSFVIDDIRITTRYLNHPALTLAYRIEVDGVTIVYCCDHEPYLRSLGKAEPMHDLDRRHGDFLAGADLVIHDGQYTDKEYPDRKGWGHSTVEYVSEICQLAGATRVAISHHDPGRTDDEIDAIVRSLQADLQGKGSPLQLFAAEEGMVVELDSSAGLAPQDATSAIFVDTPATLDPSVLLGISDARMAVLLDEAGRSIGVRTSHAPDEATMLRMAGENIPHLILVEDQPEGIDGLHVCRSVRSSDDPRLQEVPIVVVAEQERLDEGVAAGVTHWLIKPFSAQYAQVQIQAWLLRSAARWVRALIPADEESRLATLRGLSILDTEPEERFDRITRLAAAICEAPIVLVSLVEHDRQWFKSCIGIDASETSRDLSFCAHAVTSRLPVIVPDTLFDERFADNPLVVGEPRIRFYAGFPVFAIDGSCLGTLCVIDTRPRELAATTVQQLEDLAAMVEREINTPSRSSD